MDTYRARMLEIAEQQEADRLKDQRIKTALSFFILFLCSPVLYIIGVALWSILTA